MQKLFAAIVFRCRELPEKFCQEGLTASYSVEKELLVCLPAARSAPERRLRMLAATRMASSSVRDAFASMAEP